MTSAYIEEQTDLVECRYCGGEGIKIEFYDFTSAPQKCPWCAGSGVRRAGETGLLGGQVE